MPAAAKKSASKALSPAEKALAKFQAQVDKSYGAGRFVIGAEPQKYMVIPTGSLDLDRQLIVGGYVLGRIVEVWGQEGTGKSTLGIMGAIEALKMFPDKLVGWVDVEHRHDKRWMKDHGLDLKRTYIIQPDNAEDVADMVKDMCRSGQFAFIVVDSIGAMIPEAEKQKDAGDVVMGIQAKIVTRMVKIAAVEADKTGTVVFLINQVRAAIGSYGKDTTTGGGYALKHGTTMKFDIRRTAKGAMYIGSGDNRQQVGHQITVQIERNSVALAHRKAHFTLFYVPTAQYGPMGVDWADEAVRIGIETGIIQQNGGWYTSTITGEKWNGTEKVLDALRGNKEHALQIRERAIEQLEGLVLEGEGSMGEEIEVPTFGAPAADEEVDAAALAEMAERVGKDA